MAIYCIIGTVGVVAAVALTTYFIVKIVRNRKQKNKMKLEAKKLEQNINK